MCFLTLICLNIKIKMNIVPKQKIYLIKLLKFIKTILGQQSLKLIVLVMQENILVIAKNYQMTLWILLAAMQTWMKVKRKYLLVLALNLMKIVKHGLTLKILFVLLEENLVLEKLIKRMVLPLKILVSCLQKMLIKYMGI